MSIEDLIHCIDKDSLYQYYVVQGHSQKEAAEYFGLSTYKLNCLLQYYGFKKRNQNKEDPLTSIKEIIEFYKNHSLKETSTHFKIDNGRLKMELLKLGEYRKKEEWLEMRKQTCQKIYGGAAPSCNEEVILKRESTCLERYGVENYAQTEEYVKRYKETNLERYGADHYLKSDFGKNHFKEVSNLKYCTDYPSQNPEIFQKILNTNLKRYGVEHQCQRKEVLDQREATCVEKYGAKNYAQTEEYAKKYREISLQKFGVDHPLKSLAVKRKRDETFRKNGTYYSSKLEDDIYNQLCLKYGEVNVLRQFSTDKYPFKCDFYIISEDLFIEVNGHWTHGEHPFDPNNKEDIDKLETWKLKALSSSFYKVAVNVWEHSDSLKIETALKEGLHMILIYPKITLEINNGKIAEVESRVKHTGVEISP